MDKDFFKQAETKVTGILTTAKPKLMAAYGTSDFEIKTDKSVVTKLDKELEQVIREGLRKLDSGIGIEGEEFGIEGSRTTYWLLDPIDGTEQFIRGIPSCKTQLCLVHNGQVVWSLLSFFVRDELYIAARGQGATVNGKPLQMQYRPLKHAFIDIDSIESGAAKRLQRVRPHIESFVMMRDESLIYRGEIDGSIRLETGGGPWDYAPRELFYTEGGGKITNIGSNTYDFREKNFIIAHERNFDQLCRLLG